MSDEKRTEGEPHDKLTRLCAAMTDALDAHPEAEGVKCIVFLDDEKRGGLEIHGYDDDMEAMVNLFMHMKAVFAVNGKQLLLAPLNRG